MENSTTTQNNADEIISQSVEKNQEADNKSSSTDEIIQAAINKLEEQAECASGQNVPAVAIYKYLIDRCLKHREFAEAVNKEDKNINGCFKYVTDRAFLAGMKQNFTATYNQDNPLCYGMDSDEIFRLSAEYFELDNDVLETLKKAEQTLIDNARKAANEARQAAEKERAEKKAKEKAEKERAKKEQEERKAKAKEAEKAQVSLFDEEAPNESV